VFFQVLSEGSLAAVAAVYTVDINKVQQQHATRHKTIIKDCALVTPDDVDNEPLDMVGWFSCWRR